MQTLMLVFNVSGSVESAKAKALELGVKLTGQCVLEHRSPKGSEDKDSRIGTDNDDNKVRHLLRIGFNC